MSEKNRKEGEFEQGEQPLVSPESETSFFNHPLPLEFEQNGMLRLRCALYNGTFDQVFDRYRMKKLRKLGTNG